MLLNSFERMMQTIAFSLTLSHAMYKKKAGTACRVGCPPVSCVSL